MKIGLSFSRCILDIVEGKVDIDDVLIVIARTDFDPNIDSEWETIWTAYTSGMGFSKREWAGYYEKDEDKFRAVTLQLWNDGKLHQPRKFGAHVPRRQEFWLEAVLPSEELNKNPAAKKAWDNFQTVAGLTNVKIDRNYQ